MIRIIAGVYGHKENGVIEPKDSNSAPFSLDPEREAELVARGIAEYANVIIPEEEPETTPETDSSQQVEDNPKTDDNQQHDDETGNDDNQQHDDDLEAGDDEKKTKPEYSEKMKLPELQALAASFGLDAQKMRVKAEVIKLLDDYFEDDGEQPPAFGAMDPVE